MIEAEAGEAGVAAATSERPDQARFVEDADEHVTTVPGTTIRRASAPQLAVGARPLRGNGLGIRVVGFCAWCMSPKFGTFLPIHRQNRLDPSDRLGWAIPDPKDT